MRSPAFDIRRSVLLSVPMWLAAGLSSCDDDYRGDLTTVTPMHLLKLQATGQGSGIVVAPEVNPELACTVTSGALSGVCAGGYASNVAVRLIATPSVGSTFSGWSGTGCGGTDQCVVDMTQERTVTATFVRTTSR